MTVEELKVKLMSVDIQSVAAKSVRQSNDDLVEWQKEQLFSGKTNTGARIKPFYQPGTVAKKKRDGQPSDRVTLKDSGDFYDGIIADIGTEVWNLSSTDSKSSKLQNRYSPKIFGLNKISNAGFASDVRPRLLKNLHEATGL